jgi:hypothetical protein
LGSEIQDRIAAFGWWFIADAWDIDWALDELLIVITSTKRIEPDHLTLEALAKVAERQPAKTVAGLSEMLNPPHRAWLPMSREEIDRVLISALDSEDEVAKSTATTTINRLASYGFIEYRDLLAR